MCLCKTKLLSIYAAPESFVRHHCRSMSKSFLRHHQTDSVKCLFLYVCRSRSVCVLWVVREEDCQMTLIRLIIIVKITFACSIPNGFCFSSSFQLSARSCLFDHHSISLCDIFYSSIVPFTFWYDCLRYHMPFDWHVSSRGMVVLVLNCLFVLLPNWSAPSKSRSLTTTIT